MTPEEREELQKKRASDMESEIQEMDQIYTRKEEVEGSEISTVDEVSSVAEEAPMVETTSKVVEASQPELPGASTDEPTDYDFSFINDLAREATIKQSEASASSEASQPTVVATPTPRPAIATVPEMEEAFNSPEKFLELLARVEQRATEAALLQLPKVSRQVAIQVIDHAEMVSKFYQANPELVPYKDFVSFCARQVEASHVDWPREKVLEETARLAKSRLPSWVRASRASQPKPALPGGGRVSQRRSSVGGTLSALEQDIANMPDSF